MKEKKTLGIIAIILSVMALPGSWVPIIQTISFFCGLIALILGAISLFINRKNTKTVAIVGTSLSVVALAIVLLTQSLYNTVLDEVGKIVETAIRKVETSLSSSQIEDNAHFKWTKADFDALVVGDSLSGAGGTNFNEISTKFGEPQSSSETSSGSPTSKFVSYNTIGDSQYKSVSLRFIEQEDSTWLLSYKSSSGLE